MSNRPFRRVCLFTDKAAGHRLIGNVSVRRTFSGRNQGFQFNGEPSVRRLELNDSNRLVRGGTRGKSQTHRPSDVDGTPSSIHSRRRSLCFAMSVRSFAFLSPSPIMRHARTSRWRSRINGLRMITRAHAQLGNCVRRSHMNHGSVEFASGTKPSRPRFSDFGSIAVVGIMPFPFRDVYQLTARSGHESGGVRKV